MSRSAWASPSASSAELVSWVGIGVWQIMLVVFMATSVATWLGAQRLMMTQAAVQAATVMTLFPNPEAGLGRWLDAVIGGAVALVFATVAPTGPLHRPRLQAAQVLQEAAATLRGLCEALRTGDQDGAEHVLARARATESMLTQLSTAADEGIAVVRYSPFLRGRRGDMQVLADLVTPLDFMLRNLRVLVRRGVVALFRDETIPGDYLDLIEEVCVLMDVCAGELYSHRSPAAMRRRLIDLAEKTSGASPLTGLSSAVLLAQLRSIIVDLLELTGMSAADARDAVPDMGL